MKFKRIYILYLNLHKKQAFDFLNSNSYTNICFKFFFKIDNVSSYFLISSKNLKGKQLFDTDRFCNYQLLNMAVWWG